MNDDLTEEHLKQKMRSRTLEPTAWMMNSSDFVRGTDLNEIDEAISKRSSREVSVVLENL